jgi:hypothetical protein
MLIYFSLIYRYLNKFEIFVKDMKWYALAGVINFGDPSEEEGDLKFKLVP